MNYVGYKYFDDARTRRSADVLKMEPGEKLEQFKKRCVSLGFDCVDKRNVIDHYKNLSDELIKGDLEENRIANLSVLCVNIVNDFNIASCQRNCNAFGCQDLYIFGDKKYDKRGSVGVERYTPFKHVKNIDVLSELFEDFDIIVSLDNCSNSVPIDEYVWDFNKKTLIVIGQESIGVPNEILNRSNAIVYIRQRGSVRSINAANACGIALYDYSSKLNNFANQI
jgi:tRNA G18 (ribose-2'-O)-methylase SpoU